MSTAAASKSETSRVFWGAIVVLALASGGCAAMERQETLETERTLMAAGFQMRMAETPDQTAQLEQLPQRQIVPKSHGGRPMFVYADAKDCKCLYVGTERAYRRYERIMLAKGIEEDRRETAEAEEDAAMDLNTWGPWAPWW